VSTVPFSFRDLALDLSSRSQAVGGMAWMDGSGWTVSTGGSTSQPVNARTDTPGLTAATATAPRSLASVNTWAALGLAALVLVALVRGSR
jgi:hypothetical protein